MNINIGYFGLGLMIVGYLFLNSPYPNAFLVLNLTSCIILLVHARNLNDVPFALVNIVAGIALAWKLFGGGIC